jgi:hypothetical protein
MRRLRAAAVIVRMVLEPGQMFRRGEVQQFRDLHLQAPRTATDHKKWVVILTFILTWPLVSLESFEFLSNLKLERVKGIEPSFHPHLPLSCLSTCQHATLLLGCGFLR